MLYHIVSWLIISRYINISIYRGSTKATTVGWMDRINMLDSVFADSCLPLLSLLLLIMAEDNGTLVNEEQIVI